MKTKLKFLVALVGAALLASCSNPMIDDDSKDSESTASGGAVVSPQVELLATTYSYTVGGSATIAACPLFFGNGVKTCQWYTVVDDEEHPIDGATALTYVSKEDTANTYTYFAKVTNSENTVTISSGTISIEVRSPEVALVDAAKPSVEIALDKSEDAYTAGDAITLTAKASVTDGGKLSYQWYKVINGTDEIISGQTNVTYTETNISAGDYSFKVKVINTLASATGNKTAENEFTKTVTVKAQTVVNAAKPTFKNTLSATEYAVAATNVTELNGKAEVNDGGTVTYQWYKKSDSESVFTKIENGTSETYTPVVSTVGTFTYKVEAKNTNNNVNGAKEASTTMTVVITVINSTQKNAALPIVTNLTNAVYYEGDSATSLSVTYSWPADADTNTKGTVSYQWYQNGEAIAGANGTLSDGTTSITHTPSITAIGSNDYYVEVINTVASNNSEITGSKVRIANSNQVTIEVKELVAVAPTVSVTADKTTYTVGENATLTANASVDSPAKGTKSDFTYQWQRNGSDISGATSATYVSKETAAANYTYSVKVSYTVTNGTKSVSTSKSAERVIIVSEALTNAGAVTITKQPAAATYAVNATATALEVGVSVTESKTELKGDVKYQWYSNSSNSTEGGTAITGATSNTYTPKTESEGTTYYYCIVTNDAFGSATGETKKTTATSKVADIVVSTNTDKGSAGIDINFGSSD